MENKDVENILKESAEEVKTKDFSERWSDIAERISLPQETAITELSAAAVSVSPENVSVINSPIRKKLVYSLCAAFLLIVLCLSIVLPITLKKPDKPRYYNLGELKGDSVSQSEFYSKINDSRLGIADFSNIEYDLYILLYTPDRIFMGGQVEVTSEEDLLFYSITFYRTNVLTIFDIGSDYTETTINNFKIQYVTEDVDGVYATKAKAEKGEMKYQMDLVSLDSDIPGLFGKILG